jgi:hypothetical protein
MVAGTAWKESGAERVAQFGRNSSGGVIQILSHCRFQERQAEVIVEQRAEVFLPDFAPRASRFKKISDKTPSN